jgi:hypothetical protein
VRNCVRIENIDEMRRRQGIDDLELLKEIRGLGAGDFVRITLLTGNSASAGETLQVRITSIRGLLFRGKLSNRPTCPGLTKLRVGASLAFTAEHIHSVVKKQRTAENAPCRSCVPQVEDNL